MTFGIYSQKTAAEIHRRVMQTHQAVGTSPTTNYRLGVIYYALLEAAMTAATDPYTGYTQVSARILRYVHPPDPLTPYDMEDGTGDSSLVTVINRSTYSEASVGTMVLIQNIGSEWAPIWVDCDSLSSTGVISLSGSSTGSGITSGSSTGTPPP